MLREDNKIMVVKHKEKLIKLYSMLLTFWSEKTKHWRYIFGLLVSDICY